MIQRGSAIPAKVAPAVGIAVEDLDAEQKELRAKAVEAGFRIEDPSKDELVAMKAALQGIALAAAERA